MRMMLKVSLCNEAGNKAIRDGSLPKTIQKILGDLKPEAAFFGAEDGKRTGYIFFDMKNASDIPGIAEPWFLAFNAKVDLQPVMNPQDLAASAPGMEQAVKNYK